MERGSNWLESETLLLLEGKKRLANEMQYGSLMKTLRSKIQRWEYVSSFLADMGVTKSALQCEYRWTRLWKPFKSIFDYEKAIPSGQDSYWCMGASDRVAMKFPRSFDPKIFAAMKDKFGSDCAIDPRDILLDSSSHWIPANVSTPPPIKRRDGDLEQPTNGNDSDSDVVEISREEMMEHSSGKKRKKVGGMFIVKEEMQGSTRQLLDFFGDVEKDRNVNHRDIVEITR